MAKYVFNFHAQSNPTGRYCQACRAEEDSEAESGLSREEHPDGTATAPMAPTLVILAVDPGTSANPYICRFLLQHNSIMRVCVFLAHTSQHKNTAISNFTGCSLA